MHHHGIPHIYQIFRRPGLRLIARIIKLRSGWASATCAERRQPIAVIRQKQGVAKVQSLIGDEGIEDSEFRGRQICTRQVVISRKIAEHSWRIEKLLPHTSAKGTEKGAATRKVARREIEQSSVAGRIERAQQIENE